MALEDLTGGAKFIDAFTLTWPEDADPRSDGNNHIFGIKNVLNNCFPAVTGQVTSTHTELNVLDGVTATNTELNYLIGATRTLVATEVIADAAMPKAGGVFVGPVQTTTLEIGHATDTTLARSGAGDLSVEGNAIYRAGGTDVPVTDGGTGASDAATARTNLGIAIGSDVQAYSAVLDATTASFLIADETKLDGIEVLADVTDTTNVTAAGALMDSEVDADIKTLSLPANTTISAFGASLVDDASASVGRTTLGVVSATTSAEGLVERATQAEVDTGADVGRYVTPETLSNYSNLGGARSFADAAAVNTTYTSLTEVQMGIQISGSTLSSDFTINETTDRLTYTGTVTKTFKIGAHGWFSQGGGPGSGIFQHQNRVKKNGVVNGTNYWYTFTGIASRHEVSGFTIVTLATNDYLELYLTLGSLNGFTNFAPTQLAMVAEEVF